MNSIFLALFLASSSLSTLVSCQQQFEQNRPFAQQPYQQQQQPFQQQAYPQNYGQNMAQGNNKLIGALIPNAAQPNQMANVQNDSTTNDRIKKGHVVGDSYVYVKDQIGNWNKDWDNVKNMHAINDVPEPVRRYPNEPYNNNPYNSNPYGGNNYGSSNLYGGSYGYGGAYGYGAPGGGFIERGCASFPCMNNGECMQTGLYSYSCTCAFSFYGRVCEYRNVGQIVGLVLGIVLPLIFIAIALILIYVFCIRNRNLKR